MDFISSINWVNVAVTVGYVILGGIIAYYKGNAAIKGKAAEVIKTAEKEFKGVQRGGERFAWAVDYLYSFVPVAVKAFIPRSVIENIVQQTFDAMADFAKAQIDKVVDAVEGE